jgi:hypothetical protein
MDKLTETVKQVIFSYAGSSPTVRTYALSNDAQNVFAVNITDWPEKHRTAGVVVLARIENDQVVIEEDLTDKPLVQALIDAGIPREQIVQRTIQTQPEVESTGVFMEVQP